MILGINSIKRFGEFIGKLVKNFLPVCCECEDFFVTVACFGNTNEALLFKTSEKGIKRSRREGGGAVLGQTLNQRIPVLVLIGEVP